MTKRPNLLFVLADHQRRVVGNAYGPLGDPEGEPDWSMLS
jgi:hypothetical protein